MLHSASGSEHSEPQTKWTPLGRRLFQINLSWKWLNLIRISLKYVPKGNTDNKQALKQTMAWRQASVKQLSEPLKD